MVDGISHSARMAIWQMAERQVPVEGATEERQGLRELPAGGELAGGLFQDQTGSAS